MKHAIANATACDPYDGHVSAGGTCWRIAGPDLDEVETKIGVEIYRDHLGNALIVITVI